MIKLQVTVCDNNVSYVATFLGPQAEDHALAFLDSRQGSMNHVIGEVITTEPRWQPCPYGGDNGRRVEEMCEDQPDMINPSRFPRLYERLNPLCHHGMSDQMCMDPVGEHHFGTREWEQSFYGE